MQYRGGWCMQGVSDGFAFMHMHTLQLLFHLSMSMGRTRNALKLLKR